ncbi:hypothetical protein H8S23_03635 [Anaerofilum sp. BX8]|uniref:Uncharacterized protein n=1 Tax=Anaerofilum hominis TaxID=2763016 RepID=A0A923I7J9_9FIRM|nr:hypothetical protein [Anaerofilum hominis]MBC5580589.1 hypothetical protein [Anaerofilum hominis]
MMERAAAAVRDRISRIALAEAPGTRETVSARSGVRSGRPPLFCRSYYLKNGIRAYGRKKEQIKEKQRSESIDCNNQIFLLTSL